MNIAKPHFVSYEINDLSEKKAEKIKSKDIKLLAWTIENEEMYEKSQNLCDGIIFEKLTNI